MEYSCRKIKEFEKHNHVKIIVNNSFFLHEQYILDEVNRYYKQNFNAKEYIDEAFFDLGNDPIVGGRNFVRIYLFDDQILLDKMAMKEEQEEWDETVIDLKQGSLPINKSFFAILESEDNIHLTGMTVKGEFMPR